MVEQELKIIQKFKDNSQKFMISFGSKARMVTSVCFGFSATRSTSTNLKSGN